VCGGERRSRPGFERCCKNLYVSRDHTEVLYSVIDSIQCKQESVNASCRLKATAAFYGEFKGNQAKQAAQDAAALALHSAAEGTVGNAPALSANDILRLIRGAVSSVLGASVADDQPLVEAGLDSLGEPAAHAICMLICNHTCLLHVIK
jgi:hypothetical protein